MNRLSALFIIIFVSMSGIFCFKINNSNAAITDLFKIPDISRTDCINGVSGSNSDCSKLPELKFDLHDLTATKSFSTGDILNTLKAIAALAINLFIVVIQTVVGLLKGLLPFLK